MLGFSGTQLRTLVLWAPCFHMLIQETLFVLLPPMAETHTYSPIKCQ